jgi:hypothetical protein
MALTYTLHANHVLYKKGAKPPCYQQIACEELDGQFQVRVFEGTVIQQNPRFIPERNSEKEYLHNDLQEALDDASKKAAESLQTGQWRLYDPDFPIS